jgi:riboflavin synthase alpha subunit
MIHQITKTTAILAFSALTVMPAMAQEKEVDDKYVENDVVGKYVERLLSFKQDKPKASSLSLDFLRENGF